MTALWLALLLSQEPPAEPPRKQEEEKRVVVTASPLNPTDVFDAKGSADVVTADDGRRQLPRYLPDALREVPGVNVQKTGAGQGSPFIRGLTGFRTLLLIDGVRLNNSVFREGPNQYWATVDGYLADRLEVIRGPSSVQYGSDALGGTVILHTADVAMPKEGFSLRNRSVFRWASAEDSVTARDEASYATPGFGVRVGGTYRDLHDMTGGRHTGLQPNTGYDEYDADLKSVLDAGAGWRVVLGAQRHRQNEAARTHSTTSAVPFHGTAPGTDPRRDFDQRRDLVYVRAETISDDFSARVGLSFHQQGEASRRITSTLTREFRRHDVNTPGAFAHVGFRTGLGFVTVGGEVYHDNVNSGGHNTNAAGAVTTFARGEVADNAEVDLAGIFVQDELTLGDLEIEAGLRFSYERIDAGIVDPSGFGGPNLQPFDETYTAVVGSLRLLYRLGERWNLIAGISQGFRAPTLDDTTAVRLVLSGQTDFPNPDLDPERTISLELGARMKDGPFEAGAFAFRSILDDFIVRVPAPSISPTAFTKENADDAGWMHGAELYARYVLCDEWTFWADVAYAFGKAEQFENGTTDEEPLGKLPPAIGHVGLRYAPKAERTWVEVVATAMRHQGRLSPGDEADPQRIPPGGTPGFTVYTLRGGYRLMEDIHATLSIENVTDKSYRYHGSGTNEPGTNVIFGLDVRF